MLVTHILSGIVLGAASLPHCALMCGPLAAGVCTKQSAAGTAWPALALAGARTASYATIGAGLAVLGGSLLNDLPFRWAEATLAVVMGGYLAWAALRLLRRPAPQLVPLSAKKRPAASFKVPGWGIGLGMGLLPCGALWGAYLVAAVSGSAMAGALTMAGFSVASAPALLLATGVSSWLGALQRPIAIRMLSSIILAGSVVMIWRAYDALQQTGAPCCAG